jgi:3-hydroxybutyryl-CoA dehydratase
MTLDIGMFQPMVEVITQDSINRYAELSGDFNPLHVDVAFAEKSEFGGTIAHGPMQLQPCFRSLCEILGVDALPAGVTISITYRSPARPGDSASFSALSVEENEDGTGGFKVHGQSVKADDTLLADINLVIPSE